MDKENRSVYVLHEETMNWMNELEFMSDEQSFLEHLLGSHFLELSSSELYDATRKLIKKLKEVEKMGRSLMDTIQLHNKHMATMIESFQKEFNKSLDKEHSQIKKDFDNYALNFRYVKRKIFGIIKEIMKEHKQKLLIDKT